MEAQKVVMEILKRKYYKRHTCISSHCSISIISIFPYLSKSHKGPVEGLCVHHPQRHQELVVQDCIQLALGSLQEWRHHNTSGLGHSHSECSEGTSCASVCACCPWPCHWAPLRRAWLHPLCTPPSAIHIHS